MADGSLPPSPSTALVPLPAAGPLASELAHLVERAADYARSARAENTRRAYRADFQTFEAWASARGLPSLPTSPDVLALYLAALADEGRRPSTLDRALAGIGFVHREAGFAWPKGHPLVSEVMAGIRRTLGTKPKQKDPIVLSELRSLIATCDRTSRGLRDRALILCGWWGAFRRVEVVALERRHATFTPRGLLLELERSKRDQEGKGTIKGLPEVPDADLCPVAALRAWLEASGITEGALFRGIDRHGNISPDALTDRAVALVVQRHATLAGLDPERLAGHSLRAGFATAAADAGKALDAIRRQTDHRSFRSLERYVRSRDVFTNNAAAGLV